MVYLCIAVDVDFAATTTLTVIVDVFKLKIHAVVRFADSASAFYKL